MSKARMTLGNALIDLNQPASIKVIETDGKLQLCVILGLNAKKVAPSEPGEPDQQRDAIINNEVLITGRAKIGLKKTNSPMGTSQFSVTFDGDLDTKVPGTGDEFVLKMLHSDADLLPSDNGLEPSQS